MKSKKKYFENYKKKIIKKIIFASKKNENYKKTIFNENYLKKTIFKNFF